MASLQRAQLGGMTEQIQRTSQLNYDSFDLQRRYRIVIAGPTTLAAILSSFRMELGQLSKELLKWLSSSEL
jgi:hypothetical protein